MIHTERPPSLSKHQHTQPPFGRYKGLITDTDVSGWQSNFFDRWLKRKSWIYAGIYNDTIAAGLAIADTGYLGKGFIYFCHLPTQTLIEESAQFPFYFSSHFMPSLSAEWKFSIGNKIWHVNRNGQDLEIRYEGIRLKADITLENFLDGISVVAPAGKRLFNFTYKLAGIKTWAHFAFDNHHMDVEGHLGVLDFTLGFPPRHTLWNWASAAGKTSEGKVIGLNMVAHFNDGLENVLFIDSMPVFLDQADFYFNHPADKNNWTIQSKDGIVEMRFMPWGARKENIHLGLLKHQFIQPFGKFEGNISLHGNRTPFTAYGVTEQHESLW
jgi:hypothetical protein